MLLKSFSKINLTLNVNQKYKKNSLHQIQSYFCLINLFDQIKVNKIEGQKDVVRFQGKFAKFVKKKNNSITSVLKILRKKKIITNFYSILIKKNIPVFSGMGGGTGNAVILANYLTKNKINKKLLNIFSNEIGSDFKLFFYKQGFLKNLKQINKFKKTYKFYFLLVYPNIKSSTKLVYSKTKKYSSKTNFDFKKIDNKPRFIKFLIDKTNDLQSIVENQYPIIRKLVREIKQTKGCYFSRMTGSGSVCYGVFQSERLAKTALNRIKTKYPKFWLSVAKTI